MTLTLESVDLSWHIKSSFFIEPVSLGEQSTSREHSCVSTQWQCSQTTEQER